jgi:hypothetical protein
MIIKRRELIGYLYLYYAKSLGIIRTIIHNPFCPSSKYRSKYKHLTLGETFLVLSVLSNSLKILLQINGAIRFAFMVGKEILKNKFYPTMSFSRAYAKDL